jgi:hypothetical protein
VTAPETAGQDGEARADLMSLLGEAVQTAINQDPVALYRMTTDEAGELAYRITEYALPLVAQARADGEQRADEEVRERLLSRIEATMDDETSSRFDGDEDEWDQYARYVEWLAAERVQARADGMAEVEEERADLERQNCDLLKSMSAEQAAHVAALAQARADGAADERERNTYRDEKGEELFCPRCGASDPEGYTREVLDS